MKVIKIIIVFFMFFGWVACKQTTETLQVEISKDYYPTTLGKYITYKVDSTNYLLYSTTARYSTTYIKDSAEAVITDNLGRKGVRVVRYFKNKITDKDWTPKATIMVTPLTNSVEYVENNLRYIRLQNPITPNTIWNGNVHIETSGNNSLAYLGNWQYEYNDIKSPKTYGNINFPETITVKQASDTNGDFANPASPSDSTYSVEVFAKNIGLVYKHFVHWEYWPANASQSLPNYKDGYSVKLTIEDKN